jgi:hypothetical protein
MKSIVTLTVNPAIDVAASVPKVFPDHQLRCGIARRETEVADLERPSIPTNGSDEMRPPVSEIT